MLYTFNCFDSASKTILTDTFKVRGDMGKHNPYVLGHALADHLHEISDYQNVYRLFGAWQVFNITVLILQTDDDDRVLTVQLEP